MRTLGINVLETGSKAQMWVAEDELDNGRMERRWEQYFVKKKKKKNNLRRGYFMKVTLSCNLELQNYLVLLAYSI